MQKILLRSSSYQMNNQHSREVWVEVYRQAVQTLTPEGYFRNFWVGMCRWDPETVNLYQNYFS